ncbi:Diphthamide biosynthesis protein 1 [Didymella heteroderae]|uniref:Diphthamide biosynthesis protein 1 n=1 Tax=Didymella heteroderae TaxID=1769908 RepID=A0A9P4X052_9PLEO|nr:Diphthamide biosynthesis protein 1 [Didymella heteroderae]
MSLMSQAKKASAVTIDETPNLGPLLVFRHLALANCSGKSTLCAALAERYSLDHFSLGDELRSLVSDKFPGHAARIKALLSDSELETFRSNLSAGTLGPVQLTSKYVKERVFPTGCDRKNVRILIDGFPRDAQRWAPFKEFAKPYWTPSRKSLLVVLHVEEEVASERFTNRGRPGDVFERRFREHAEMINRIVEALEKDDLTVCRLCQDDKNLETVVTSLANLLNKSFAREKCTAI